MNTNQSHQTRSRKEIHRSVHMHGMLNTFSYFLLPVLSKIIELSFPGMLNGVTLTPEMIAVFMKSLTQSSQ